MQMHSVLASDVVLVTRVWEIIHLNIVHHACSDKTETVLPEDYRVYGALTYEQLALEVLRLVDQTCLLVSLRIDMRTVHVTLSIHDLIPLPVDDRTSCYSDLEYIRVVGYE